jgi:hypothetical protein
VRITIIVEGKTEQAFKPHLLGFLKARLAGPMPTLDFRPFDGRIPKGDKLRRDVERLLGDRKTPADEVVALTDVYTGSQPPDFADAADAKAKMRQWVGPNEHFHPHAAQHDFEAWLLPYWDKIKQLAGSNRACPAANPEQVNHMNPPAHRLAEVYRAGSKGRQYVKVREAAAILRGKDLLVAADKCPELKSFLNTILQKCNGPAIP